MQNSQADTARRQDVNHVVSALEQYKVDNQGNLDTLPIDVNYPHSSHNGLMGYIGGSLGSEVADVHVVYGATAQISSVGNILVTHYNTGVLCTGDIRIPTPNNVAVTVVLSSNKMYCVSLQ